MKKPLKFALRGAVGFGMAAWFTYMGLEWIEMMRSGEIQYSPNLVLFIIFGNPILLAVLGATVLFYGSAHWIRAALGFGLCFSPALGMLDIVITMAGEVGPNGPAFDEALTIVVIWGIGHSVYAGLGGLFKQLALALPAVIAFGLPGLILGTLAMMTHYQGSLLWFLGLPVSGALFGFFVGRAEDRFRPTPPPPD